MKVRETALNLKRFEVESKSKKVEALKQMIDEFEQMANELGRQVIAEEERTGIREASHFAYSTFARSAAQRQANLLASIDDIRKKLEAAIIEHDEALSELDQSDIATRKDGDTMSLGTNTQHQATN